MYEAAALRTFLVLLCKGVVVELLLDCCSSSGMSVCQSEQGVSPTIHSIQAHSPVYRMYYDKLRTCVMVPRVIATSSYNGIVKVGVVIATMIIILIPFPKCQMARDTRQPNHDDDPSPFHPCAWLPPHSPTCP